MNVLREKILKSLEILSLNDRDLNSIIIYCNLNNPHHRKSLGGFSNREVKNELEKMKDEGIVYSQWEELYETKYRLWSIDEIRK